jgi:hypothetical protein
VETVGLQKVGEAIGAALVELARCHRGEIEHLDGLVIDLGDLEGANLTKAWTRAQLDFLDRRLSQAGLRTECETSAALRLPPDLIGLGSDAAPVVHIERETRGWEWNHIFRRACQTNFC